MMSGLPQSILTAVLTPLNHKLVADYDLLVRHMKWLLQRGNNGIALLGTTGEANSFSTDERTGILEAVLEGGIDPGVLLVGTGCCSITDTVTLTKHAISNKVFNILLLPPFYYKQINDTGLDNYVTELIERVGDNNLKIYLYHFPQLTGISFTTELTQKLVSKFPRHIIGMKDSGGDLSHMQQILKAVPGFQLYAGSEKFLLPVLKAGGVGCISATANLTSPEVAVVYKAWKTGAGEREQARATQLREVLEKYPSIGTLKYLFAKLSGNKDWLNIRPPNTILSPEKGEEIVNKLKELNYSASLNFN